MTTTHEEYISMHTELYFELDEKHPSVEAICTPKKLGIEPMDVWVSKDDLELVQGWQPIALQVNAWTSWPEFSCRKTDADKDMTQYGYGADSGAPLARALVCVLLGMRRELLEECEVWPLDGRHLNCTRQNIMVQRKGKQYGAGDAVSLVSLYVTVQEYGWLVAIDLDRLFRMNRCLELMGALQ
jgi:hypothetical protein